MQKTTYELSSLTQSPDFKMSCVEFSKFDRDKNTEQLYSSKITTPKKIERYERFICRIKLKRQVDWVLKQL